MAAIRFQDIKSCYSVLGVSERATREEIKSAFRRKVKSTHPDVQPTSTNDSEIKRVVEAYQTLVNDSFRSRYDKLQQSFTQSGTSAAPLPMYRQSYTKSIYYRDPNVAAKGLALIVFAVIALTLLMSGTSILSASPLKARAHQDPDVKRELTRLGLILQEDQWTPNTVTVGNNIFHFSSSLNFSWSDFAKSLHGKKQVAAILQSARSPGIYRDFQERRGPPLLVALAWLY